MVRSCALQQAVTLLKEENEVCLHSDQAFGASAAIKIGIDQLLHLEGLKTNVPPDTCNILFQASKIPVHIHPHLRGID
jgi:hypothetical protein